jgi:hypothetical protein
MKKSIILSILLVGVLAAQPSRQHRIVDLRLWEKYVEQERNRTAKDTAVADSEAALWRARLQAFIDKFNEFIAKANAGEFDLERWQEAQKRFHRVSDPQFCHRPALKRNPEGTEVREEHLLKPLSRCY